MGVGELDTGLSTSVPKEGKHMNAEGKHTNEEGKHTNEEGKHTNAIASIASSHN